jgi:HK97 family phage prohead protease
MKFKNCGLQVKDLDDQKGIVQIYVSAFGNKDSDGDIIHRGAYAKTIAEKGPKGSGRIKHLVQHKFDQIIGKALDMYEDEKGLFVESQLVDTTLGRDALELYKHNLYEHSVGFQIVKGDWNKLADAYEIKEINLYEYSAVTWGANANTPLVGMKSLSKDEQADYAKSLLERLDRLAIAHRKGKFSDPTFELLDLEILQIKAVVADLIDSLKGTEPGNTTQQDNEPKIDGTELLSILKTAISI